MGSEANFVGKRKNELEAEEAGAAKQRRIRRLEVSAGMQSMPSRGPHKMGRERSERILWGRGRMNWKPKKPAQRSEDGFVGWKFILTSERTQASDVHP